MRLSTPLLSPILQFAFGTMAAAQPPAAPQRVDTHPYRSPAPQPSQVEMVAAATRKRGKPSRKSHGTTASAAASSAGMGTGPTRTLRRNAAPSSDSARAAFTAQIATQPVSGVSLNGGAAALDGRGDSDDNSGVASYSNDVGAEDSDAGQGTADDLELGPSASGGSSFTLTVQSPSPRSPAAGAGRRRVPELVDVDAPHAPSPGKLAASDTNSADLEHAADSTSSHASTAAVPLLHSAAPDQPGLLHGDPEFDANMVMLFSTVQQWATSIKAVTSYTEVAAHQFVSGIFVFSLLMLWLQDFDGRSASITIALLAPVLPVLTMVITLAWGGQLALLTDALGIRGIARQGLLVYAMYGVPGMVSVLLQVAGGTLRKAPVSPQDAMSVFSSLVWGHVVGIATYAFVTWILNAGPR
jgi:hypothetical protein